MAKHLYPGGYSSYNFPGLDPIAEVYMETLVRELDAMDDDDLPESYFVDPNLEFDHPEVPAFLGKMAAVLDESQGDAMSVYRTVRLSFHFAHTLGTKLLGRTSSISMEPLPFGEGVGYLDAREQLPEIVSDYLSGRPTLDGLIIAYLPNIDETQQYPHVAELVAGSTFLGIETAEHERAIHETLASVSFDELFGN